jgi:hypothetical protein
MKTVILLSPIYDYVTRTMNAWARIAKVGVYTAYDLDGYSVTEENLRSCLQKFPAAELIVFYGHGEPDCLLVKSIEGVGTALVHTVGPGVLPVELRARHVYAVACHAGSKLGPALASASCHFVGYKGGLSVVKYFEDYFGKVVNAGLVSWANEPKTCNEIRDQVRNEWLQLSDALVLEKFFENSQRRRYKFLAVKEALKNGERVCAYSPA